MVASAISSKCLPSGYLQLKGGYTAPYVSLGQGDPIVLVPGLAGGIDLLEPLMRELAIDHRVICYELRGEHAPVFTRSFGFEQLVDDLHDVIDQLGLERPGLAGVSFGGAIALDFATRASHKVAFVASQGAGTRFRPGLFGDVARAVLDRLPLPDDNPFINQFFKVLTGSKRTRDEHLEFIARRCWQTDQCLMSYRMGLLDEYDLDERLWAIRTPTLVLGADHDVLVHVDEARDLARRIPRARFQQVTGAGHLAFVTHPAAMANAIRTFKSVLPTV